MKSTIPKYKQFLLSFVKPIIAYDTETGSLAGNVNYTITKTLFGTVYVVEEGVMFAGCRTSRFSCKEPNPQSIPREGSPLVFEPLDLSKLKFVTFDDKHLKLHKDLVRKK